MTILGCLALSALCLSINGKEKLSNYNYQLNVKRNKNLSLKRYGFLSVCQPLLCGLLTVNQLTNVDKCESRFYSVIHKEVVQEINFLRTYCDYKQRKYNSVTS